MLLPVLLSYRKRRFHTIINALRGCALGARVLLGGDLLGQIQREAEGIVQLEGVH